MQKSQKKIVSERYRFMLSIDGVAGFMVFSRLKLKSEFTKNVLTLMTGTTIAQAIPIAISPILTRMYSPEDFGLLALFLSVVTMIAVVSTGRYEIAIMLPEKEDDSINLLYLSLFIAIGVSLLSFAGIFFFKSHIVILLGNEDIASWLYLAPILILFRGVIQSFTVWYNRKKKYLLLSKRRVLQSSTVGIVQLLSHTSLGGLIIGRFVGDIISALLFVKDFSRDFKMYVQKFSLQRMRELAKIYYKYPTINSMQAFTDIARINVITLLINIVFSVTQLGFYNLAFRTLQAPLTLIGKSVSQVLFQKVAEQYNVGKPTWPILKKIVVKLAFVSLVPFTIILFFAPDIFRFVFGQEWAIAGVYSQYLTPWFFMNFISSPISTTPLVLKKEKPFFLISLVYNISLPLSFYVASLVFTDLKYILLSFSVVGFLFLAFIIFWIRYIAITVDKTQELKT